MFVLFPFLAAYWFWIVFVMFILLLWCEAFEANIFPIWCLIIGFGLLWYVDALPSYDTIKSNMVYIVAAIPAYFGLGFIWSFVKWIMFLYDKREEAQKELEAYKRRYRQYLKDWEKESKQESSISGLEKPKETIPWTFEEYMDTKRYANYNTPPKAGDYKSRIVHWICYWPTSVIWFLISDMIKKIGNFLFQMFSGWYQKLSNKIFSDL